MSSQGVMMNDYFLHRTPVKKETLSPGSLSDNHFWLLIDISSIHSKKVINALRDFLVLGYTRKESCIHNGVSPSYFSTSLSRLQHVNSMMFQLAPYYSWFYRDNQNRIFLIYPYLSYLLQKGVCYEKVNHYLCNCNDHSCGFCNGISGWYSVLW